MVGQCFYDTREPDYKQVDLASKAPKEVAPYKKGNCSRNSERTDAISWIQLSAYLVPTSTVRCVSFQIRMESGMGRNLTFQHCGDTWCGPPRVRRTHKDLRVAMICSHPELQLLDAHQLMAPLIQRVRRQRPLDVRNKQHAAPYSDTSARWL